MIIVYGTRSSESNKRLPMPCGNCGQPALMQNNWVRYFHIMFIPTFPVGKQASIQCHSCGNSFDAKGSAPFWTYLGGIGLALCFLGGAAHQAIHRLGIGASTADITSSIGGDSSSASAPAASSAPPTTKAAAAKPPAAGATAQPAAASADGGAPVTAASGAAAKGKKKKKH